MRWGGISAALLCAIAMSMGCDRGAVAESSDRVEDAPTGKAGEATATKEEVVDQEGLLIGELRLARNPVVDGDTIRVEGIEKSVRLLKIDTEEIFRGNRQRAAAEADFEAYRARKRSRGGRPRRYGTPMGEKAADFARDFFKGAKRVRLERDDPKSTRGQHGRPLAYAFVKKNGRWTSYSVECVRAGMSAYFTKYGYSKRFGNQLARAEAEARQAKRGIWDPEAEGYGDYDERKAWWDARADFIREFEHEAGGRDDYVELWQADAGARLEKMVGQEVALLSTVDRIEHFKGLSRISLVNETKRGFPLIFFEKSVLRESGIERYRGEPIVVRGEIDPYEKGSYRTLQIVVERPNQIRLPKLPPID